MKPKNAEAERLEADYLTRVKAAIGDREPSEVDEILDSLREHIGEELSEAATDRITLVQMANVLERLGPPESYAEGEGIALTKDASPGLRTNEARARLSRLAVAAALCLPSEFLAWALLIVLGGNTDIGVVCAAFALFSGGVAGLLLGLAALVAIRNSREALRGRAFAWIGVLILPALLIWTTIVFVSSVAPSCPEAEKEMIRELQRDVQRKNLNHDYTSGPPAKIK
jgi:hypothetical protein